MKNRIAGLLKAIVVAEIDDPAVRRAARVLALAAWAALVAALRANGVEVPVSLP